MKTRATRRTAPSPDPNEQAAAVEQALHGVFTPDVVDELRQETGYNPRQRTGTAIRLMLTIVEGFLLGQTLSFASLRAIFVRRFEFIRPCPFQKRFKQESAVAFFRAALGRLVTSVVEASGLKLQGPLAKFTDVRVYDGTGQRVPARGREELPACAKGKAGAKWMVGFSLKTGILEEATGAAETSAELPLWRQLVPNLVQGALYLLDLGFFERKLFHDAQKAGAHVLMRLKSATVIRIVGRRTKNGYGPVANWKLSYFLRNVSKAAGTTYDLDVIWGTGKNALQLRAVGIAHKSNAVRWYLTTVPCSMLSAKQIIQAYRLRWLIEFLFRELKQTADLGRSFTSDIHAVQALTYGAMLAHVVVRSLRVQAALAHEIPLEQLRPLACLHVARAFAREIVDGLASVSAAVWSRTSAQVTQHLATLAREVKPSRSRQRIALLLGAAGG
jgi:Transposase DDE domain